jgi:hypothetical protein
MSKPKSPSRPSRRTKPAKPAHGEPCPNPDEYIKPETTQPSSPPSDDSDCEDETGQACP